MLWNIITWHKSDDVVGYGEMMDVNSHILWCLFPMIHKPTEPVVRLIFSVIWHLFKSKPMHVHYQHQVHRLSLNQQVVHLRNIWLYFVSSRERPWRHWSRQRIYAAWGIIYASIPGFFFERARKHTCYARNNKHLPLEYVLTSWSFLRRDKV